MPIPVDRLPRVIQQWETQRCRPEHQGERIVVFYSWRILTVLCAVVGYLLGQIGVPVVLVILIARRVPELSDTVLGTVYFLLIAIGFLSGFYLAKVIDAVLLQIELRNSLPDSPTLPIVPR